MSAPAAKAFSEPPRTMQRISSSASSSTSASTSEAHDLVVERVQRLRPVEEDDPDRRLALDEDDAHSFALHELPHRFLRLLGRHREGQPVARVVDRLVPGEVAPEVELLLRVAHGLRELGRELLDQLVDRRVEVRRRHRAVHEPPLLGLPRRDLLAEKDDLARAALADHDREPLSGAARRDGAVLRADVADVRVVDDDGEVAGHLELVAASHADPVDARERRLADLPHPVVGVLERAEPLPVLVRLAEVVAAPRLQVGADAERPPGAGDHHDADRVVPGRVLARTRDLPQHAEVERVEDLRPVERDRRARRRLLVDDRLEAELGRVARRRVGRLRHSTSAKWTWKGTPISIASLPVAMNSSVRAAALKASRSGNSHSA